MLAKLLRRPGKSTPPATIPDGERVYAIGDIHGRDDLLERLLTLIDSDDAARGAADTTIISLGDLVDRGPRSADVIERLMRLQADRPRVRILAGNHEEIFLGAIAGDAKALRMFTRIGGRETILSYGIDTVEYDRLDYAELHERLGSLVPESHRDFMRGFEDMIVIGGYAFVHAGVRPGVGLEDQRTGDLRWIREPFLNHGRTLGHVIVHGHTITESVEERPHRIGIDTGAYSSGRLTAIGLERGERWYLTAE